MAPAAFTWFQIRRPADVPAFAIAGPVLVANGRSYDFSGQDVTGAAPALTPIAASQEFCQ